MKYEIDGEEVDAGTYDKFDRVGTYVRRNGDYVSYPFVRTAEMKTMRAERALVVTDGSSMMIVDRSILRAYEQHLSDGRVVVENVRRDGTVTFQTVYHEALNSPVRNKWYRSDGTFASSTLNVLHDGIKYRHVVAYKRFHATVTLREIDYELYGLYVTRNDRDGSVTKLWYGTYASTFGEVIGREAHDMEVYVATARVRRQVLAWMIVAKRRNVARDVAITIAGMIVDTYCLAEGPIAEYYIAYLKGELEE
jgi:hypothetical protein